MVVEKATELGVSGIILVQTDRVIKKGVNLERLEKIAIEASEQCGRIDVPTVVKSESLEELLNSKDFDKKVVLDMGGKSIKEVPKGEKTLLFIGPEGGWSDEERKLFKDTQTVSISENVLRAETAAIVGVGMLL